MEQRSEASAVARRKALGAFIRALRGPRTQSDLAKLLGNISQAAVSAWENGLVDLTCEQVRDIEVALGVRPGTLGLAAGYVELQRGELQGTEDRMTGAPSELIARHWFYTVEDAVEAVQAADTLGLGVRLWNLEVREAEDQEFVLRWVVEISRETSQEVSPDEAQADRFE